MQVIQIDRDGAIRALKEDIARKAMSRKDCVYLLSKPQYDVFIAAETDIRTHPDKHPDKALAQYLLSRGKTRRGGIETIYADFSSGKRLVKSVEALLAKAHDHDYPSLMVVGVPVIRFEELLVRAGETPEAEPAAPQYIPHVTEALLSKKQRLQMAVIREEFRGTNPDAEAVRFQILEAAASKRTVTIQGETGTGKEIIARLIHKFSRPDRNFVPVNCGAIPGPLVESELFGHEPYAFTNAGPRVKTGLWEQAADGTLFLDEIGDLPLEAQVKILRALDTRKIRRVGGVEDIQVKARVVVATNRNLRRMVEMGTFREDLFYRIRVLVIRTPSLIENGAHLAGVIQEFWNRLSSDGESEENEPAQDSPASIPPLSPAVLEMLAKRSWVGNYRDLKNFLRALWEHAQFCNAPKVLPLHVKATEKNYGPSPKSPEDDGINAVDREVVRMRYMQHHAMCAEALRGLQLALAPLAKRGGTIPDDFEIRLRNGAAELALLLSKPHRFYDAQTFHTIEEACNAVEELLCTLPKGEVRIRTLAKRGTLVKINAGLDATFRGSC